MTFRSNYTEKDFKEAVETSSSMKEVMLKLGMKSDGGNYKVIIKKAKYYNIDLSHLYSPIGIRKEYIAKRRYTDEQFIEAVSSSSSIREVLRKLGLAPHGGNYKTFHSKKRQLKLSTTHFTGQGHLRGKTHSYTPSRPLNEILVVDSPHQTSSSLHRRLVKEGILENKCVWCGISSWREESLSLHMDHINGINTDNHIENLRLLCPNCHSQTDTYCGKNKPKSIKSKKEPHIFNPKPIPQPCIDCGTLINSGTTGYCVKCKNKHYTTKHPTKIQWPNKEELEKLVWEMPTIHLAKQLGVSDNAINHHCKKLQIIKPSRGYWQKKNT